VAIGEKWNTDNPNKVWAFFDPDADIKIPVGIDEWLTELGVGYASHEVLAAAPLECADEGAYSPGQRIRVRMKLVTTPTYTANKLYPFTLRVYGDDGTTKDDLTLYLKIKDDLSGGVQPDD
jgi:hypothetical protein